MNATANDAPKYNSVLLFTKMQLFIRIQEAAVYQISIDLPFMERSKI
jgi:hypothetical protein